MEQKRSKYLLIPIFITICLDFISLGVVLPVITPLLLTNSTGLLPASFTEAQRTIVLGFLISAFSISSFFGAPFMGAWSDTVGRKKVLRFSLFISCISFVLFGLGITLSNIWLLFLGRILGGFAAANVNTCVAAMVDITEPKDRVKNFGLIGFASFACGYVVGPLIGGLYSNSAILPFFTYSTPFYFVAVWSLMNLAIIEFFFTETLKHKMHEKMSFLTGLQGVGKIFSLRQLRYIFLVCFLITFGFNFFDQFFQVFLIQKFELNTTQIAQALGVLGVSMAVTQGFLLRLVPKNTKPLTVLLISLPAVALLMPSLLLPNNPFGVYLLLPLIALFQGLSWPYSAALLSDMAEERLHGEVLGINASLTGLAIGLPPLLSGILSAWNMNLPLMVAGACGLLAWAVLILKLSVFRKVVSVANP